MADHVTIGAAFLTKFLSFFDNYAARREMANFYRADSTFTWNGVHTNGVDEITDYLMNNTPKNISTKVSAVDCQLGAQGSIVMLVTGYFVIDGASDKPTNYAGIILIVPDPEIPGGYYVRNDHCRLLD